MATLQVECCGNAFKAQSVSSYCLKFQVFSFAILSDYHSGMFRAVITAIIIRPFEGCCLYT